MDPTNVPATTPNIDPPVIHDDTPLIPAEAPTISPITSMIPPNAPTTHYTSPFIYTDSSDDDTPYTPPSPTHKIPPVGKTCSWWYPKFTPSGYTWKPKSGKENVNPNISMPLGNASRTANVMNPMTSRRFTVLKTPLSSNYFVARRDCPIYRRLWVLKAHDWKSQASN
uniref:Uncharacterized protein n=1 Tax=Tanacetum cinerariifolium TaxID=118510 RepID=A0A699Q4H2_TANCI|nr:hypothetical protein [Tanacetum cinerariifolium]